MALQIWMPLNGNSENNGLSDVTITPVGGNASYSNGKTGQGLSCDGSAKYYNINPINLGSEASFAWWSKTSVNGKIAWCMKADSYSYVLSMYEYNIYTLNTGDSNNNPFKNNGSNVSVLHDGKWHHFTITFGNNVAKLYIDGYYAGTAPTFKNPTATNSYIKLGGHSDGNYSYYWNGMLDDFRVYDHCLSPREVNDISKGLIVHYPLSTRDVLTNKYTSVTWNQILTNGDFSNGTSGWSGYVPNTITQISVENNELIVTKVGGTVGGYAYVNNVTFDTTHLYYVKAAVKALDVADHDTHYATFGFSKTDGTVGGNTQIYIYSLEYTIRSFVSSPVNATDRLIVRAGKGQTSPTYSVKCKNIMCVDLTLMFGEGNEPTKEECDVIFYDNYYAYDPGTVKNISEPVYDYSGYGRNAVVPSATKLSLVSGSSRYDMCTANTVSYPLAATFDFPESSGLTVSLWVNMGTIGFQGSGLFTTSNRVSGTPNDYNTTTFDHYDGSIRLYGTNGTLYSVTISASNDISTNTWTHIVLTHDGTNAKLYANGVLKRTVSVPTPLVGFKRLFLGTSWAGGTNRYCLGKWSDFRMYATALKAEDVLDLYRTSASVDDCGNLHTFNLTENKTNIFNYDEFLKCSYTYFGWTSRNGEYALKINPTYYYRNSTYTHIFEGDFLPNTQYKFDLWVDADDCLDGNNINRPAGIWVYYTDSTRDNIYITGNSSSPIGFQHKVFYTNSEKSVSHIQIYYYVGTGAYYRWDSMIIPVEETVNIEKDGTTNAGYFREGCGEVFASIGNGGNFDINNIVEK